MHFSRNRSTARNVVRLPAVAGDFRGFYPSTPSILSEQVGELIDNADVKPTTGELIGLIAPHAGYAYSGHVAGNAYKLLRKSFYTVILIGLSHRYRVRGAAIYARGAFRTPLGDIEIDEELAAQIIERSDTVVELPEAHEDEHSLKVQLPFLQRLGANRLEVLKAANSGDVPMGGRDRVVGYMAALYRG